MSERFASGTTIVLVSHDAAAIERVCERVVVLDGGRVVFDGPTAEGLLHYHRLMGTEHGSGLSVRRREAPADIGVVDVELADATGRNSHGFRSGDPMQVAITVRTQTDTRLTLEIRSQAGTLAPGLNGAVRPMKRFKPHPEDLLLLHHSAATPRLRELLALPNRKLLPYHNVTPPWWLWEHAPVQAVQCAVGREQLPELVRSVDVAAADSAFNAQELEAAGAERAQVIPLLIDLSRLGSAPPGNADLTKRAPTILFVGRLPPHKRQDEVIRTFASTGDTAPHTHG